MTLSFYDQGTKDVFNGVASREANRIYSKTLERIQPRSKSSA